MKTVGQVALDVFGPTVVIYHSATQHVEVTCVWASEETRSEVDPQSGTEREVRMATLNFVPVGGVDGLPEQPTSRSWIEKDGFVWSVFQVTDKSDSHCTIQVIREQEIARSHRGRRS